MTNELNYNYYGIPIGRELSALWDTDIKLGSIINHTIYDNGFTWEEIPIPNKAFYPLDNSVYLWHLPPNATFACNSMYNIAVSNTLNIDIATNKENTNVPFSVAAVVTQSGFDSSAGFTTSVRARLAWNDGGYNWVYPQSELTYDIPYIKYCVGCGVGIFNFESTPAVVGAQVNGIHTYIDNHPTADITYLRCDLYAGNNGDRRLGDVGAPAQSERTTPAGGLTGSYWKRMTYDVLAPKPVCDSATGVKSILRDGHADWIDDKFYMPFTYRYKFHLGNNTRSTNMDYQHIIGLNQYYNYSTLRTGAATGYGGITAQFFRYNSDRHDFDDVSYHWDLVWFDDTNKIILENGFDITSMTGGGRIMTKLVIDDYKGQSRGIALERAVKHELAYLGFYFTDTQTRAESAILGSTGTGVGVYLPEKIGGVTTGRYFTGDEIKNVPYADAENVSAWRYDPEDLPGGEDTGDFRTRINSGAISAGTIYYAVSDTEFKDLVRYLNTTYNPDEADLAADFKGVNPFDYLTSVKYYPFPLPYAVAQQINVGPLATGVTGYIMPYTYGNAAYSYFDFGSYTFTPRFKNFLDYSATQIQLFLPWCGVVNLDPTIWIAPPGYNPITLKIRYSFDYVTGSVTAFIFRDNGQGEFLIDTADGSAGVDVPLSLFATGSYQQQIAQAQIAYKQAATSRFATWAGVVGGLIGAGVSAAFGNPLGVVGGIGAAGGGLLKLKQAELQTDAVSYTLDHTQPQLGSVSAASPFNAAVMDQRPFILITRPRMQSTLPNTWETTYAHTVGYACTVPASLSDPRVRGFTIIQSSRLEGIKKSIGSATFTPTEQELALIRQHMAAGIIL